MYLLIWQCHSLSQSVSVGRIKLILDELLEMKDNNETQIEIDNVVLSVAGLIYLINKLFLS
jgi:hypothetical protein